jgi:hypothetical protein
LIDVLLPCRPRDRVDEHRADNIPFAKERDQFIGHLESVEELWMLYEIDAGKQRKPQRRSEKQSNI